MLKCTARNSSGRKRARVLHRACRRHVELTDQHQDDVTLHDRRLRGGERTGLELLLLDTYCLCNRMSP